MDSPEFSDSLPRGYLDFLTWQGRSIQLFPENDVGGGIVVSNIKIWLGRKLVSQNPCDPLTNWKENKKKGWLPLRFIEGKALWRDSTALFPQGTDNRSSPENIKNLALLKEDCVLDENQIYTIDAIGMGSKPGQKIIWFWRHERMPLPLTYLGNDDLVAELGNSLSNAEKGAQALRDALRLLASKVFSDKKDVTNYTTHLAGDNLYWSRMEESFYRFLVDLPKDPEAEQVKWSQTVKKTAQDAFEDTVRDLDRSARMHKARVIARATLNSKLMRKE